MRNVYKEALADAQEFVAATMSFGEGAGIRRRHIDEAVQYKMYKIPGYSEAFTRAKENVDVSKAIKSAKRTGRVREIRDFTGKNARALARGDKRSMSTSIIIVAVGAAVLHETGYDKVLYAKTKVKVQSARKWLKDRL